MRWAMCLVVVLGCSDRPNLEVEVAGVGPSARVLVDGENVGRVLAVDQTVIPARASLRIEVDLGLRADACARLGSGTLIIDRGSASEPFMGDVVPGCDLGFSAVVEAMDRVFGTLREAEDRGLISGELASEVQGAARSVGVEVGAATPKSE